jgi:hypothetical protein
MPIAPDLLVRLLLLVLVLGEQGVLGWVCDTGAGWLLSEVSLLACPLLCFAEGIRPAAQRWCVVVIMY